MTNTNNMKNTPKAGDRLSLPITDLTQKGQGVGHVDGFTIFVDDAVVGDVVDVRITEAKRNYAVGKLLKLITAAPSRVAAACPYFKDCGGCQLQHMAYEDQLAFKRKTVVDALEHIGGMTDASSLVANTLGMENPWRYRNKAQYKLRDYGVGFYRQNSHAVIPIDDCLNQPESCQGVIAASKAMIEEGILPLYDEKTFKGELRGVNQRTNQHGDEMITLVVTKARPKTYEAITKVFTEHVPNLKSIFININAGKGNTLMGKETRCIYGEDKITETVNHLDFSISPRSFFQVNTQQTQVLYDQVKALAGLTGKEVVFDLFCGTGTIGLYLADQAKKVVGIDVIADAIDDAKHNAEVNNIANAQFHVGKAEWILEKVIKDGDAPDLVVVDPPRKGIDGHIIDLIAEQAVPKVVYVSCNPASLARDLQRFMEKGYAVMSVQPVDLFPQTGHVETVVLMSRVKK